MKDLPIYLEPWAAERALKGRFRFVGLLADAAAALGYRATVTPFGPMTEYGIDPDDDAPALYWRMRPASKGGRVFREAWHAPFWRIERAYERWNWDIAGEAFDPARMDQHEARRFCNRQRDRMDIQPAVGSATIIALQGEILRHRSFQSMSPLDMIRDVIAKVSGPIRIIRHPNAPLRADEERALARLCRDDRVTLHNGPTAPFLPDAARFVTQNSTTTIDAVLSGLPVTLYAKSDFHHISVPLGQTTDRDRAEAFAYWYLTTHTIRAGQDDVLDQIIRRLVALGF